MIMMVMLFCPSVFLTIDNRILARKCIVVDACKHWQIECFLFVVLVLVLVFFFFWGGLFEIDVIMFKNGGCDDMIFPVCFSRRRNRILASEFVFVDARLVE